jgi:hypothetical protein
LKLGRLPYSSITRLSLNRPISAELYRTNAVRLKLKRSGAAMLIRLGDVIYWIAAVCAVLWLGVGIWVYYVDPNSPSEATFVLLMFIGSAILIYVGGWCVRYIISGKKNVTGR